MKVGIWLISAFVLEISNAVACKLEDITVYNQQAFKVIYTDGKSKDIWLKNLPINFYYSNNLSPEAQMQAEHGTWNEPGLVGDTIYPVGKDGKPITDGRKLSIYEIDSLKTSPAIYYCESMGAHLPTIKDFQNLSDCFEHQFNDQRFFTQKGLDDFENAFWDFSKYPLRPLGREYWTSSVSDFFETYYFSSAGKHDAIVGKMFPDEIYRIRCVVHESNL